MFEIVGILLALLAAVFIGYPFYRGPSGSSFFTTNHRAEELEAQKAEIYKAIKDIDFDFQMGKLSQEDYDELRGQYKSQAVAILREIDAASGRARRGRQKVTAQRFCHQCGSEVEKADKYCASCGASLQ